MSQIGTSDGMCKSVHEMLLVVHKTALLLQYAFFVFDPTILTITMYSFGDLNIMVLL